MKIIHLDYMSVAAEKDKWVDRFGRIFAGTEGP